MNWNNFVKKFDDEEWKSNEKNKPIIDNLANLLNCSSDEINSNKINGEINNLNINLKVTIADYGRL